MKYQTKKEEKMYETTVNNCLEECVHKDAGLISRLKTGVQACLTGLLLGYAALGATGCCSTIIQNPNINYLKQASDGTLYYNGKKARLERVEPWYIDMWPDTCPEYLGSALMFGAGVGAGSALSNSGSGDSGGRGDSEVDITTPPDTTPTSGRSSGGGSSGRSSGGDTGGDSDGSSGGSSDDDGGLVEEEE